MADAQFVRIGGPSNYELFRRGPRVMQERRVRIEAETRRSGPSRRIIDHGTSATRRIIARVRPMVTRPLPGAASRLFDKTV